MKKFCFFRLRHRLLTEIDSQSTWSIVKSKIGRMVIFHDKAIQEVCVSVSRIAELKH